MKRCQQQLIMVMAGVLIFGVGCFSSKVQAGSATAVFNFTTTFIGGGCDISAPSSLQFNRGETLFAADIEAAGIAGSDATTAQFNVSLKNCAGWGFTPSIAVSGQKMTISGTTLFRDSDALGSMDSVGYGVLLRTVGNSSFNENVNLADNGVISAKNWLTDTDLNTVDNNIPIIAILSCANCTTVGRHGGKFQATVIFDFVYD